MTPSNFNCRRHRDGRQVVFPARFQSVSTLLVCREDPCVRLVSRANTPGLIVIVRRMPGRLTQALLIKEDAETLVCNGEMLWVVGDAKVTSARSDHEDFAVFKIADMISASGCTTKFGTQT